MVVGLALVGFMIEKQWDRIANNHFMPHMFICFCMLIINHIMASSNSCLEKEVAAFDASCKMRFGVFPILNGNIFCLLFFLVILLLKFLHTIFCVCWRRIVGA